MGRERVVGLDWKGSGYSVSESLPPVSRPSLIPKKQYPRLTHQAIQSVRDFVIRTPLSGPAQNSQLGSTALWVRLSGSRTEA